MLAIHSFGAPPAWLRLIRGGLSQCPKLFSIQNEAQSTPGS
jgi:hypothetical protein